MNEFYKAITYVNENYYEPNHLVINTVREETQNSDYGAGIFQLNSKSVRFRVAKTTPNKVGQFVSLWEKDASHKNQAFSYEKATDLLVINTFANKNRFGQFVFPKEVLLQQKILKTATTKGKMAIRVYPTWDKPTNKQAIETQKWQLEYFIETDNTNNLSQQELLKLYS
ncbi:MepB family protein [Ornithinibacillus sp. BX22]|uniref:MepB family protein n=2 Tax=Ornithinibacillus TaxID=484508 RepID=A0A923L9L3_9BACI|nr:MULTISPECIES: MepB family protein [Ornithinibacillus]MBC5638819.1 MepB family protein [Ornithinibacillus hominis]MBS3679812.1 MepB family protein [Ornithinibacillus massiliensis]